MLLLGLVLVVVGVVLNVGVLLVLGVVLAIVGALLYTGQSYGRIGGRHWY